MCYYHGRCILWRLLRFWGHYVCTANTWRRRSCALAKVKLLLTLRAGLQQCVHGRQQYNIRAKTRDLRADHNNIVSRTCASIGKYSKQIINDADRVRRRCGGGKNKNKKCFRDIWQFFSKRCSVDGFVLNNIIYVVFTIVSTS